MINNLVGGKFSFVSTIPNKFGVTVTQVNMNMKKLIYRFH